MRGLRTPVSDLRKSIFTEVAKIAYEADSANLNDAVEAVPYTVCPGDVPTYVKVFIENVRLQQKE